MGIVQLDVHNPHHLASSKHYQHDNEAICPSGGMGLVDSLDPTLGDPS